MAVRDRRGQWRYDPRSVAAEAARRGGGKARTVAASGETAGEAFVLFRDHGIDIRRAVIELRITPDEAEGLAAAYARAGGEVILTREGLATLRTRLGSRADLHTEAELLQAVMDRTVRATADFDRQAAEREETWKARLSTVEAALADARAQIKHAGDASQISAGGVASGSTSTPPRVSPSVDAPAAGRPPKTG